MGKAAGPTGVVSEMMKAAGGSKRHSIHAVELSHRSGKPRANCVDSSCPQQAHIFGQATHVDLLAGNAPHKSGGCRD